ncbi:MAG: response regulator [Butyrivibrio sp.]|nr:response regulator [Butyrivibrio sp.]
MGQHKRIHIFIIGVLNILCLTYIIVSIVQEWELWVPPLMIIGVIGLWLMHIGQLGDERNREIFYLLYAMLITFFHGVHDDSFFDISVISILMLIVFSMLNHILYLNILLVEFFILAIIQLVMVIIQYNDTYYSLNTVRIALHIMAELCVYLACSMLISNNSEKERVLGEREKEIDTYAKDTEDFLTNISHELRTPVNVVNGMSTLILKNEVTPQVKSIYDAGLRLSRQIEDIQDYTEIKRGDLILEEEQYIITSMVNDLLTSFRMSDNANNLELVVDLDPNVPTVMIGDIRKIHKMLRHLLDNAMKFTRKGGIYVKIAGIKREYGINLEIEVTDTGIGMTRKEKSNVSKGLYQANKKRDRSTGGIGLGLSIVYGFIHEMEGFALVESAKGSGTTVRISIPQKVVDATPCLSIDTNLVRNIIFYVKAEKFDVPEVRDFYSKMAMHIAAGLRLNLYSASDTNEIEEIMDKIEVSHIFMGVEEYSANAEYFDEITGLGIVVVVSANPDFVKPVNSRIVVMQKPLYGYPIAKILNDGNKAYIYEEETSLSLENLHVLIVDDEPMNLVVASGLFNEYGMITDTAESGLSAIKKFAENDYDIIFMDHMMPEMDGVEAMKRLRLIARDKGVSINVIALTANAVSGAREMFMREGFDGFISKPIDITEFERVMKKVLPKTVAQSAGGKL